MKLLKTYKWFVIFVVVNMLLYFVNHKIGSIAAQNTVNNFGEMLKVLPPIFVLIGLFDVWGPRETLIKFMGEESGIMGMLLAFFMGSFTAGPLYAAFPVATILMKKGSKFTNVLIFIGAWSSTKLPLMLFETSNLGLTFTLIRFVLNIIGITLMAFVIDGLTGKEEKERVYKIAEVA
jgi:uncharacterized membrane protein YraQ (UPF0718 family)